MSTSPLATVDEQKNESTLSQLQARTTALSVRDMESYTAGRTLQAEWKSYLASIDAELDTGISKAKETYDHLRRQKAKWADPAEAQLKATRALCDKYAAEEKEKTRLEQQREQERINRERQEKIEQDRREAERVAAERRKLRVAEINADLKAGKIGKREAAKQLKEAGAEAEAAAQTAAAVAEEAKNKPAPVIKVKPNLPAVAGTKSQTYYSAEVSNEDWLIDAFHDATGERREFLRRFIMVNQQEVGAHARKTKDNNQTMADIPGCIATSRG